MDPYITFVALNTVICFLSLDSNTSYKEIELPYYNCKIVFWTRERKTKELSRSKTEIGRRERKKKERLHKSLVSSI